MSIEIVHYSPNRHDETTVASMILDTDPDIQPLIFLPHLEPLEAIEKLMQMQGTWYSYPCLRCIQVDDEIVGAVSIFDTRLMPAMEKGIVTGLIKILGMRAFLKKVPFLLRIKPLMWQKFDQPGYYIHSLSISRKHRNRGLGSRVIDLLAQEHGRLYLDVGISNNSGLEFYERKGFTLGGKNIVRAKGKNLGTYSLLKDIEPNKEMQQPCM